MSHDILPTFCDKFSRSFHPEMMCQYVRVGVEVEVHAGSGLGDSLGSGVGGSLSMGCQFG